MTESGFSSTLSFDRFSIQNCWVEPAALTIRSGAGVSTTEPKVMILLQVMAERPHSTWHRDELIRRIWPNADGGDESLTRLVYLLRKAFSSIHNIKSLIKTVPKIGYRLEAEIQRGDSLISDGQRFWPTDQPPQLTRPLISGLTEGRTGPASEPGRASLRRSLYSVAVLPVQGQSTDTELLRDGMTRGLTALLSRSHWLHVSPSSSVSFVTRSQDDPTDIANALKVKYLVSAFLTTHNRRIRINVELIDAVNARLEWTETFEAAVDHFYDVEGDIVQSISTAISTKVRSTNLPPKESLRPFEIETYERVQLAKNLRANYGPQTAQQIKQHLEEALLIEPDNPIVKAELAVQLSQNVVSKWTEDEAATKKRANRLIAEALSTAPNDSDVIIAMGIVSTMFHNPDAAIAYLERAVDINPNAAHARAVLGWQRCLRHADSDGIALIEKAEAQAPHHPRFGLWATYRGTAHLFMLDYKAAIPACQDAIIRTPNYYQPHLSLAWAYVGAGKIALAQTCVTRAKKYGSADIATEFVSEIKKWSENSPNKRECGIVLDQLMSV